MMHQAPRFTSAWLPDPILEAVLAYVANIRAERFPPDPC